MSRHPISQNRRAQLLEIASDWVVRIQGGELSSKELDAWIEWLNASPDHRQAFDDAQEIWHDLGDLKHIREPGDASVAADRYDAEAPIAVWREQQQSVGQRRRWSRPLAVAALLILGAGIVSLLQWLPDSVAPQARYSTVVAQHQTVDLPDGSSVELGAATAIDVHFTEAERRIELHEGIAYFSVEHDPGRPFVVSANGGSVRAIGTEFSVQRTEEAVTVIVTDGLVEVHKPQATGLMPVDDSRQPLRVQLPAGQQVSYSTGAGLQLPSVTDVEAATAWRDGRLVLQGRTLDQAITDINRYSALPIELDDAEIGALQVSGYVRTDEIDAWLSGLEAVFPVRIEVQQDRVLIRRQ